MRRNHIFFSRKLIKRWGLRRDTWGWGEGALLEGSSRDRRCRGRGRRSDEAPPRFHGKDKPE